MTSITQTSTSSRQAENASADARRPRRVGQEEKRRRIVNAARRVFTTLGYDRASMNDIAVEAGVSKPTLYVYFEHKEALFAALVEELRANLPECNAILDVDVEDVRGTLIRYASRLVVKLTRPDHVAFMRMVIGAANAFPELGRITYAAGPEVGRERAAQFFAEQSRRGRLNVPDPYLAASQFLSLSQATFAKQMLFNVGEVPTEAEISAYVEPAVDMFLSIYGVRESTGAEQKIAVAS